MASGERIHGCGERDIPGRALRWRPGGDPASVSSVAMCNTSARTIDRDLDAKKVVQSESWYSENDGEGLQPVAEAGNHSH